MADSAFLPTSPIALSATPPKLLDRLRAALRVRHRSRRTEDSSAHWVKRFIVFHGRRHPRDLGAADVASFLSALVVRDQVSASTQNQALCAILFLYEHVLATPLGQMPDIVRASVRPRLPVVLTREEVRTLLGKLDVTPRLVARLLYGSGLRLLEALALRVKDIDAARHQIIVRRGKGDKDRVAPLPLSVCDELDVHLDRVRASHARDLAAGLGRVVLPDALARKYPNASTE